ncbi:hypothetical protein N7520_008276 [Penicillium odoratum]|uniref:uncharacterized protein n=1 Tax=Penicillium odoratum TaxID=1167516 RepID=UPI0025492B5E|nr:uncharacterized protein N7520_008276 [Penicillium odoratum]KAJ5761120.1 hypothetical protein N7520_008276 [Penicillium odoratum]
MTIQTPAVRIVEVGPRDGLQNIQERIPTATKLELIRRLRECGLTTIELTSVVSPRAVPQLSDCRDILSDEDVQEAMSDPSLRFPVLVPNLKGLEIAIQQGVKEIAVFISASDGFSKANINCSVEVAIERAKEVISLAMEANIVVRGYVSCIFEDPYDGPTSPESTLHCVKSLLDAGCYEVSLGDTTGVGSPWKVRGLIKYLKQHCIPLTKLAGHFHDTYGQAAANVWEAYKAGIRVFDSSVSGLGGCPFAPGAKGNVATEELVLMFNAAGIETGVELSKLVETGEWILRQLNRDSERIGTVHPRNEDLKKTSRSVFSTFSHANRSRLYRSGLNLKSILNGSTRFGSRVNDCV